MRWKHPALSSPLPASPGESDLSTVTADGAPSDGIRVVVSGAVLRFEQSLWIGCRRNPGKSGEYELWAMCPVSSSVGCCSSAAVGRRQHFHPIPPVESRSYIEMTWRLQRRFGVESRWQTKPPSSSRRGRKYRPPCDYTEGDYSQAQAFPAVLGAVQGGVTLKGLSTILLQGMIPDSRHRESFRTTDAGSCSEKAPLHGVGH